MSDVRKETALVELCRFYYVPACGQFLSRPLIDHGLIDKDKDRCKSCRGKACGDTDVQRKTLFKYAESVIIKNRKDQDETVPCEFKTEQKVYPSLFDQEERKHYSERKEQYRSVQKISGHIKQQREYEYVYSDTKDILEQIDLIES